MTTNIRFLYTNLLDISSVDLTASSEATTLPVENLLNPLKCIPWRTTGSDFEYVDIDLGQACMAQAFAATGHNYTDQASLILCGDDSDTFHQQIDTNHIGFWKFIGDSLDSSSSENDLTAVSIATSDYFAARQDRAVALDGENDYFHIPAVDAGDFNFTQTQDFSIEIWFKPESIPNAGLLSKWDGTKGYFLEIKSDGMLHFKASDGAFSDEIQGSAILSADTWHCVAVTADRDGQLNLYLDGEADSLPVTMSAGNLSNTADFIIGKHTAAFFSGALASAAVSNSARSASYVSDSFNTPKIVLPVTYSDDCLLECFDSSYIRYWRFIISDPDNADAFLNTGRLYLGEWFEPSRNFHGNWIKRIVDPSGITATLNNIEFSDVRGKYTEIDLSFPKEVQIPQSDAEKYEEMFSYVGAHKRLFIALDYENQPRRWTYYGTLTGDRSLSHLPGTSHTDGRWTISNLKFKESR
jgi:hypothetical protein